LTDHEIEELLPAYALGATEPEERRQVEAHLVECERCRTNLASYRSVTEGLLYSAIPTRPPKTLRARLLAQLSKSTELPSWRKTIRELPAAGLALTVAVILLLAVNLGFLVRTQQQFEQGQYAMAQLQAGQAAAAIGSYPSSEVAVIEEGGVRGTFVYDPSLPVGVMYVWGLNPPPGEQAYQTWLIDAEGQRISGGLLNFSEDQGLSWLLIEAPMAMMEFVSLGVTLEPAEGSPVPTGPRILGTDL
jgi:anti-sigma-K factor RskA